MIIKLDKIFYFVKVFFLEFLFVGVWMVKLGIFFLCIELWYGIVDGVGEFVELWDKVGIEYLELEVVFVFEYEIIVG